MGQKTKINTVCTVFVLPHREMLLNLQINLPVASSQQTVKSKTDVMDVRARLTKSSVLEGLSSAWKDVSVLDWEEFFGFLTVSTDSVALKSRFLLACSSSSSTCSPTVQERSEESWRYRFRY